MLEDSNQREEEKKKKRRKKGKNFLEQAIREKKNFEKYSLLALKTPCPEENS